VSVCSQLFVTTNSKPIEARWVTYSRRVHGLHPCICADSKSDLFEVDGTAFEVEARGAVVLPVAVPATPLVSIRTYVALVAEPEEGANPSTSEDNDRANFNPFQ
jgi:hypothetical protein